MKIDYSDPDQLQIHHKPWFLWLFGALFMAVGLGVTLGIAQVNTLECTRGAECILKRTSLIGSKERAFPASELGTARTRESTDSDGDTTYRAWLTISGEWVPFTSHTSSGRSAHDRVTNAVNAFVNSHDQPTLSAVKDDRFFGILFGGVFFLAGAAVAFLMGKIVDVSFNSRTQEFSLRRRGLYRSSHLSYPLRDVQTADVQISTSKDSTTYRVAIVMRNGERLPVTGYYSSGRGPKDQVAKAIREFLRDAKKRPPPRIIPPDPFAAVDAPLWEQAPAAVPEAVPIEVAIDASARDLFPEPDEWSNTHGGW